jgi:hypothetical protein
MSQEQISMIMGVLISLGFSYIPGLKDWFNKLNGNEKRVIMLVLLLVIPLAGFGLSCFGRGEYYTCNQDGLWLVLESFILAAIANQGAYQLTPK